MHSTAGYLAFLSRRQGGPQIELSWRCLCCQDTAIIPPYLIQKYKLLDMDEALGEMTHWPSSEAQLCQNQGCEANEIEVEVEGSRRMSNRYTRWATRQDIRPELCRWVHEQEWEEVRQGQKPTTQYKSAQPVVPALSEKPRKKSALVPVAKVIRPSPSDVLPEECQGFQVGDRVVIDLHEFDVEAKRQIMKEDGIPLGSSGEITSFSLNQADLAYGDRSVMASLLLDDGRVFKVGIGSISEAVAV